MSDDIRRMHSWQPGRFDHELEEARRLQLPPFHVSDEDRRDLGPRLFPLDPVTPGRERIGWPL
jgi:hypothetical protein